MTYQRRKAGTQEWEHAGEGAAPPELYEGFEYRLSPWPAAPKWPQTTMTISELGGIYTRTPTDRTLKEFANIILAHACETGALVPADKVREIEAKARAEGAKSTPDAEKIIQAAFEYLRVGDAFPVHIQNILARAAK